MTRHAPALLPLVLADPSVLADVLHRPLSLPEHEDAVRAAFLSQTETFEDGDDLRRVLRRLRHRGIVRIALREVMKLADVDQTSKEMSYLACAAIDAALSACQRSARHRYGQAVDSHGQAIEICVLGMGKLGGYELNLGSDVDLIFFYATDDGNVDQAELSVHEYFTRVATWTSHALSDVTADGLCFRVDLRLRPEGSRGPLVNSLASAERYYTSFGRTWERAAMLRARAVAGDLVFGEHLLTTLRPFVYRRAVEPELHSEMASLLLRARRDLHVDDARDIKLGRGGIREAEFFVQTLQLIWGGQHKNLQVRGTMDALGCLRALGLVTAREAHSLAEDWALLRRIEHRIHMTAGYQTHCIPNSGAALDSFAQSLGEIDGGALEQTLQDARERVATLFSSLSPERVTEPELEVAALLDHLTHNLSTAELAERVGAFLGATDPDETAAHLARLARHAQSPFGSFGRARCPGLGELLLKEISQTIDPAAALRYLSDFFTRMGGVWGYDRLLLERPHFARRLLGLFGSSATLSTALVGHPETLDVLVTSGAPPSDTEIAAQHTELTFDPEQEESFVSHLRRLKRELSLRVGIAHIDREIDLKSALVSLTSLAEAQIAAAFRFAQLESCARYGITPQAGPNPLPLPMVIVGLGKLGGWELGFGSDLDLFFVYGPEESMPGLSRTCPATHTEILARTAQRTMRLLSQPDAEGNGYQTDTRLRPNGTQGLLVVSLPAFDRYHQETARTWERQSLIRARPLAGDAALQTTLDRRIQRNAYESPPNHPEELSAIRKRMQIELAQERPGRYHCKVGYGALVDVEFIVQWLQMTHGKVSQVRHQNTLEAIHRLQAEEWLTNEDAETLSDAYGFFRQIEQTIKLLDETRDAVLESRGRLGARVARSLRLRPRDGVHQSDVLEATWRRKASAVRDIFNKVIAPVNVEAPWSRSQGTA